MTIVSAIPTQFLKLPIPGEDSDPYYDQFVELMNVVEKWSYMNALIRNIFLSGGGTRLWDGMNGIFEWTDDFTVPIFFWGKRLLLRYGPDNASRNFQLQNGQAAVIEIPYVIGTDTVVNFSVVSQLDQTKPNQWVVGWRDGSSLWLHTLGQIT